MPENSKSSINSKIISLLPILLAAMVILGMFIGFQLQKSFPETPQKTRIAEGQKIEEILRFIENKYVDRVDREVLMKRAIDGLLDELDPHSQYIPAQKVDAVNDQLEGVFEGIGVEFHILNDTIVVVSVAKEGPAEKAGIIAGDKIISVGDTLLAGVGITSEEVVENLRGKKDSQITLNISRVSKDEPFQITLRRDHVPVKSVEAAYLIDPNTAFIKVNRFTQNTFKEFMTNVESLHESGMENLIIDLRQNPGGYLTQSTKILNQLFDDKNLLVYTEGRSYQRSEYKSTGRSFFNIDKLGVLIDEGSASASEILAAAIQDLDRGKIIGRRSFGKGLVQEQYDLRDGSALRLTVARYYAPSGRLIQKQYKNQAAYKKDIENRAARGELMSQDSLALQDSTVYHTATGRVVYGGRGVKPDIFVPINEALNAPKYLKALPMVAPFTFGFVHRHRSTLKSFDTLESLEQHLDEQMPSIFKSFIDHAQKQNVNLDQKETFVSSNLQNRLKAWIIRQMFDKEAYQKIVNTIDPTVLRAVEYCKSQTSENLSTQNRN